MSSIKDKVKQSLTEGLKKIEVTSSYALDAFSKDGKYHLKIIEYKSDGTYVVHKEIDLGDFRGKALVRIGHIINTKILKGVDYPESVK